ncbi:Isotrichodermin C-15 hydroxylase [Neolecta irregularis DAH-3]|uniref:Isotrichodermin C-15 hydroxylase n=1 Tax=Neolecta irregularis (strain DAH-3) TaxID=1198029 RepID=A0A1U7LVZ9_NEOID|nr:Isotrichodermin C-15 hydroxylase [Neolecta irregularis DAH-3]|eukprot:OLL26798.1 Isotrichodermin C-15 hydroxylase [Neolecta irregularis DAH-3]
MQQAIFLFTSVILPTLCWILYQLYFCPLSKFPGPFWAKINPFWHAYQVSTGQRHKRFTRLHQQYGREVFEFSQRVLGDIVRVGLNDISVCNVSGQRDLHQHGVTLIKSPGYNAFRADLRYSNVFNEQNKIAHGQLRREISAAFSTRSLEGLEKYVEKNVVAFCNGIKRFGKDGKQPLKDITLWSTFLTFDVLGDLCFSKTYGMLETGVKNPIIEAVQSSVRMTSVFAIAPHLLFLMLRVSPKNLIEKRRLESYDRLRERLSTKSVRKDFFHYLVDNGKFEETDEADIGHLQSIMQTFLGAGGDTTSCTVSFVSYFTHSLATITAAIYYLCKNPLAQSKLRQEVAKEFYSVEDISHRRLATLTYLNAVIEETLRIAPPVLGELPRLTTAPDTIVAGCHFPIGVTLSNCHYALSRDARYFTDPESFIPERWFENGFDKDQTLGVEAKYQPFSLGPRKCIGFSMAYMEIRLTLAHWIFQFDAELEDPFYRYEPEDYTLAIRPPLLVKARSRL